MGSALLRIAPALVLALAAGSLAADAHAKCAFATAWAEPAAGPLPTNGRILFEAYGAARPDLDALSTLRPRLESGKDVVPLAVVGKHEGDFAVRQAILAPQRPLRAGATYTFHVDPLPSGVAVAPQDYAVAARADTAPPVWSGAPRVVGRSFRPLGCGPEAHVEIAIPATDDLGPLRVEAEVRDGTRTTTYVVPVTNGTIELGHGMCSGPFAMASGAAYQVTLRAVDAAGQATPMPGRPLTVLAPTASTP
jgi:hypothetical protein